MSPPAPAPDVVIAGRGYVRLRDSESGKEILLPADSELSGEEAERHYRRSSEVMARQVERGKAPWMRPRDSRHALPENVDRGSPYGGQNAVWLVAAADQRGYADHRWGTRGDIEAAGGRVRAGEQGITAVAWHEHARTGQRRAFSMTVFNAEQCDGLPPPGRGTPWRAGAPSPREVIAPVADEMPPEEAFRGQEAYLQHGLRRVGRWTGHPDRLDRPSASAPAGTPDADRERLREEIHALLAGCRLGVGHEPRRHPPATAAAWARALREDPREIYRAAAEAERMLAYAADRARPRVRPPGPPALAAAPAPLADLARGILENPPWDRARCALLRWIRALHARPRPAG